MSLTEWLGKHGVPGFRSGKWWKMAIAIFGYFFIFIFILGVISGPPQQTNTTPQSKLTNTTPQSKITEYPIEISVGTEAEYTDVLTYYGSVAKSKDGYRFVVLRLIVNDTSTKNDSYNIEWSRFKLTSGRHEYPVDSATQMYTGSFNLKIYSGRKTPITLVFQVPTENVPDLTFKYDYNDWESISAKLR